MLLIGFRSTSPHFSKFGSGMAAGRGLGTCLVGGLDRAAITDRLGLGPQDYPAYLQPVGWPA